jgi:uncharacterized protein
MPYLKILCISDKIDPLIYSNSIKERFYDIDLVLSAGDLDLNYYGFIVSSLNKPLLFVFGNHNLKALHQYRKNINGTELNMSGSRIYDPKSCGSLYIGDKVKKVKSLLIAGLGGSINYNGGKNQYTEIEMTFKILRLLPRLIFNRIFYKRWLDIFVTHTPPRGLGDKDDKCHQGFKIFRLFNKIFKPKFHLHGHIHLYDQNAPREMDFIATKILNIYEHQVITIEVP